MECDASMNEDDPLKRMLKKRKDEMSKWGFVRKLIWKIFGV